MGVNSSKKLAAKCSFLSKDEQHIVSNSFRLASKNSEKIKEEELTVNSGLFLSGAPNLKWTLEIMGLTNGLASFTIYKQLFVWYRRITHANC
jgi:hypothetical protein